MVLAFGTTSSSYAESDWKIYHLDATVIENGKSVHEIFKIPYKITNGTLGIIRYDAGSLTINAKTTTNNGILEITIPMNLINTSFGETDNKFFVLINGQETDYQEGSRAPCFRTFIIKFDLNSEEIVITSEKSAIMQPVNSFMPPIYINTNKNSFDSKVMTISGCTDLKLDDKQVILNMTNTQTGKNKILSVTLDINGSFSRDVPVEDLGGNGNYTVNATYAGKSTSETVEVVPEFPTSAIALLISISVLILISSGSRLKF